MHIGTVLYGTYEYRTLQAPHLQFSTSTSTDQYNTMQYPYSTCTRPARQFNKPKICIFRMEFGRMLNRT